MYIHIIIFDDVIFGLLGFFVCVQYINYNCNLFRVYITVSTKPPRKQIYGTFYFSRVHAEK